MTINGNRTLAIAVIALMSLLLPACQRTANKEAATESQSDSAQPSADAADTSDVAVAPDSSDAAAAEIDLKVIWSTSVGDGDESGIHFVPALADGQLYVPSANGTITSLGTENGNTVWQQRLDDPISAGVGAGAGKVVAATREGQIFALDGASGEVVWQYPVYSEVLAGPVVGADIVVGRSVDGKVFGMRASDGEPVWGYQREVPSLTLRGASRPLLFEGVAISGFANGRVVANEIEDGEIIWELPVADARGRNELERLIDIDADPVMLGSVLYVAVYGGQLTALALGSKRVLWQQDISSRQRISVDTNHVYVTDEDNVVHAVDRLTGELAWRQNEFSLSDDDVILGGPVLFAGELLVPDDNGQLHVLDAVTGARLDTLNLSGDIAGGGIVADRERAYVLSRSGKVYSLGTQ